MKDTQANKIVIAERDNIAAVIENGKVAEFFVHRGDIILGDVYYAINLIEEVFMTVQFLPIHYDPINTHYLRQWQGQWFFGMMIILCVIMHCRF